MKSYNKELWLDIQNRMEFVNITNDIKEAVNNSGIKKVYAL